MFRVGKGLDGAGNGCRMYMNELKEGHDENARSCTSHIEEKKSKVA